MTCIKKFSRWAWINQWNTLCCFVQFLCFHLSQLAVMRNKTFILQQQMFQPSAVLSHVHRWRHSLRWCRTNCNRWEFAAICDPLNAYYNPYLLLNQNPMLTSLFRKHTNSTIKVWFSHWIWRYRSDDMNTVNLRVIVASAN